LSLNLRDPFAIMRSLGHRFGSHGDKGVIMEAQPQDPQAARFAEPSRNAGGFWQTLPGILTATGSFLAGLAGWAAVLAPHLFTPAAKPPADTPAQVMSSGPPSPTAPVVNASPEAPAQAAALPRDASAPIVQSRPNPPEEEPVATAADPPADDRYVAAFASDGFVVLRAEPTIASAEIRRILVGGAVRCGKPHWSANGYRWRRCVDAEGEAGYMADTFLRKDG